MSLFISSRVSEKHSDPVYFCHPIDTSFESRQKGIECCYNSFNRVHQYVKNFPLPVWEKDLSLGLIAHQNAFRRLMGELGCEKEEIEALIDKATLEANRPGETYEVFQKYLMHPSKLDDNQLQYVTDLDDDLNNTEWDGRFILFETLSENYQELYAKDPESVKYLSGRYIACRFELYVEEERAKAMAKRKKLIAQELPDVAPKGQTLAAVYAARGGFTFLPGQGKDRASYAFMADKVDEILKKTPLVAGGNLGRQFKDGQFGHWGEFSQHAVVIMGKKDDRTLIICDPACPNLPRYEDETDFLVRANKLYYHPDGLQD